MHCIGLFLLCAHAREANIQAHGIVTAMVEFASVFSLILVAIADVLGANFLINYL